MLKHHFPNTTVFDMAEDMLCTASTAVYFGVFRVIQTKTLNYFLMVRLCQKIPGKCQKQGGHFASCVLTERWV